MGKNQISIMLKLTQALFFMNALIWFLFSVANLVRVMETGSAIRWILTAMMIANAVILVWFGVTIANKHAQIFFLANHLIQKGNNF